MQNHEKYNFGGKCKIPENVVEVKNVKSRIFVTVKNRKPLQINTCGIIGNEKNYMKNHEIL